MFGQPVRTIREGYAAATQDARPDMERAKAYGVVLGLMAMDEDRFFDQPKSCITAEISMTGLRYCRMQTTVDPQTNPVGHAIEQIQGLHEMNHGERLTILAAL